MTYPTEPIDNVGPGPTSGAALLARFLRFGFLAWGGPVAQIAMLRRELVDEEHWIPGDRFNRLLAVYQVLPGPEAHELAVHMGFLRRGRLGAVLAGLGFMLPGFVLMFALSALYFQIDLRQAAIAGAFLGVQIAVIALVVRAVMRIGKHILVGPGLWVLAAAVAMATLAGVGFLVALGVAGAGHLLAGRVGARGAMAVYATVPALAAVALGLAVFGGGGIGLHATEGVTPNPVGPATGPAVASPLDLFVSGLRAGLLTFGGAYTAIPFLRDDAVGNGWLTDAQFLDGLALGGVLPAPLIIFSTFIGYVAGGPVGAVAITIGIFLPAFAFALILGNRIEAVLEHEGLRRFLEGVAAGVVGLIAVTALDVALVVAMRLPAPIAGLLIFAGAYAVLALWASRAAIPVVIALGALAGWIAFGLQ